jgi:DNA-binding transcriptional regulator YiaG
MWKSDQLKLEIELVEGDEMIVAVETPVGLVKIMASVRLQGRVLYLDGVHIQGLRPGGLNRAGLNAIGWKKPMPTNYSFKAALERRDATGEKRRAGSASRTARLVLLAPGPIERPVDFIRLLAGHGLSLRNARTVLERLAARLPAVAELDVDRLHLVLSELKKLDVLAAVFSVPEVDVKKIREEQQLSQSEFAQLYGLELNTVKNWEQGRYEPDGPAKVLLSVINSHPSAVIDALVQGKGSTLSHRLK